MKASSALAKSLSVGCIQDPKLFKKRDLETRSQGPQGTKKRKTKWEDGQHFPVRNKGDRGDQRPSTEPPRTSSSCRCHADSSWEPTSRQSPDFHWNARKKTFRQVSHTQHLHCALQVTRNVGTEHQLEYEQPSGRTFPHQTQTATRRTAAKMAAGDTQGIAWQRARPHKGAAIEAKRPRTDTIVVSRATRCFHVHAVNEIIRGSAEDDLLKLISCK